MPGLQLAFVGQESSRAFQLAAIGYARHYRTHQIDIGLAAARRVAAAYHGAEAPYYRRMPA